MKPTVSIIVPIYGVEEYLDQCVETIVNQTYENLEIILVDDESKDNCPKMCDDWLAKDSRIKVIHKKNGGLSDARNAGIDIATGDYIIFVDSDDYVTTNMVEVLLSAIKKENVDIVAANHFLAYEDGNVEQSRNIPSFTAGPEETYEYLYDDTRYCVHAWNKIYKAELWKDFRFPVGKLCEDAMTTYLLIDKSKKISQINEFLYYYRIRGGSIMTEDFKPAKMDEEEAWRLNYEYMKENHTQHFKAAFDFYLQRVNVLVHTIPIEKRDNEYKEQFDYLYDVMKKNRGYILLKSKLPIKQRIAWLKGSTDLK